MKGQGVCSRKFLLVIEVGGEEWRYTSERVAKTCIRRSWLQQKDCLLV
jgi:hypothetical protein